MKAILLFVAITGGLLSFNSYAVSCSAGIRIPAGTTYKPFYTVKNPAGGFFHFINIDGCEYWSESGGAETSDGWFGSYEGFVSTGNSAKPGFPPSVSESDDKPDSPDSGDSGDSGPSGNPDAPDKPGENPPDPFPEYSKPPAPNDINYVNKMLAYIASRTPAELYTSLGLEYDPSHSWVDNRMVYDAFTSKLQHTPPPSYKTYEVLQSLLHSFSLAYYPSTPGLPEIPDYCYKTIVPSVCDYYTSRSLAATHYYALPSVIYYEFEYPPRIVDPNYASYSDYKLGITRCDRNPNSASCNKPDDNPGGDSGNKPDDKPGQPDNPGTGGGSGSGSTDNNDNGDVVAAIDRFHADNNASHKQLLDELKKKDDYSDTTNKAGDLFTKGMSDFKSGAESSVNSLIDSLDKYAPGLKGFGLPDGFYSGGGRCVPLDMSFSFTVPMVNYSVPVKLSTDNVCKFYDGYPRELLRMLIYMLTVFVLIALLKQSLK
ncbi:TPA: hypothetical protein R0445_000292 [Salmonella enterica subsp. enterica serovar Hvittingfoss]|nr:hypothetical protein [Salmonella enterica subsp. enterica serovar Hvittingfoss]